METQHSHLPAGSSVDLYWIPLGAGHHSVRLNGIVYEATKAKLENRQRYALCHSVLHLQFSHGSYWVEMTPVPDGFGRRRGVVAEGPVGFSALGRFRPFRYEIRRWRDGIVPDLDFAMGPAIRVTTDHAQTAAVLECLPRVPRLTWGRDESRCGEMWSCNSVISWALTTAGVPIDDVPVPPRSRAPGWSAGIALARRESTSGSHPNRTLTSLRSVSHQRHS